MDFLLEYYFYIQIDLFRIQQSCFSRMFACQTRLCWETLMKESIFFADAGNLVRSGYFGRIWIKLFNNLVKKTVFVQFQDCIICHSDSISPGRSDCTCPVVRIRFLNILRLKSGFGFCSWIRSILRFLLI